MAIPLVGVATANSGTTSSTAMTATLPGAAAAGHVAVFWADSGTATGHTVTGPTGWTEHVNGPNAGNCKPGLWSKTLTTADITAGTVTATRSAAGAWSVVLAVYSGTVGPDVLSAAGASTTPTAAPVIPTVTPSVADCLRLGFLATQVSTAATAGTQTAPPAGWSLVGQTIDTSSVNSRRLAIVDSIQLSGQAGVAQATASATTDQTVTYVCYSLTLAPSLTTAAASLAVTATLNPGAVRATTTGASLAVTATLSAAATVTGTTVAGFSQGFLKPAPFGTATTVPTPPAPLPPTTEGPRPVLELGFSTDPLVGGGTYAHWGDAERGAWDTVGVWAPDEVWTDVTQWLQSCSFRRGATRVEGPILRYEAGTLTAALRNDDGRFHPANLAGPYVSAGRTQVRPMLPARYGVAYAGTTYWQWRGHVEGFKVTYPSPTHSVASFNATDAQMVLSSQSRAAGPPVGAGELSGARVRRILTSAGWPSSDRRVDNGQTPLQATTLEGDPWAELLLVQDTELGEVYVDAVGKVTFKSRYAILTETLSTTSQAIFGAWGQPGELPYVSVVYDAGDVADIRNVHRITRVGGSPQEARDDASVAEFLEHTHERTDLFMQTDPEALNFAQYLLALSKDPADTFTEITVDPRAHPDLWVQVLTRDFGDRVTVRSRPPVVGLIERDVFIRGVAGEYRGTNQWGWTWTLQPAGRFNFGVWGAGAWGTSQWAF